MGADQSKCKCLYLPAQSGKTRKMEELIKQYKLGELFDPVDINIIISANNKLLVEQTTSRMTKDLATDSEEGSNDACIKGNVFSWTSGTKESNISPDALAFRLLDGEIEMVVICAHATRLRYLSETIKRLASSRTFAKKINIWIDEADKSINLWSKYEDVIARTCCINQVTLVSATFDAVVSKYKSLCVLPYNQTHPECYRGLGGAVDDEKNAKRHEDNFVGSAPDYVRHVIKTHRDKLTKPGMRAFIPGSQETCSHDAIAEFLHKECKFVVIVINGKRREILVPDKCPIDLRCYFTMHDDQISQEFNVELAKLYKENKWHLFPLAITGYCCVQRGVTFQCGPQEDVHDGFVFDYGIVPPIACPAEAYQTMARLFGNVGNIPNYKPVEIYTNFATFRLVEKQENIAINIARIVYQQNLEVVTKKELKAAEISESEAIKMCRIYKDEGVVREVCKILEYTYRSSPTNDAGFKETSLNAKSRVASLNSALMKVKSGYGTNHGEKTYRTCYPCYVDTTNSATLRFVVIIRPPPPNEKETEKKIREDKLIKCDDKYKPLTLTEAMTL
jgi:hypothetical protein